MNHLGLNEQDIKIINEEIYQKIKSMPDFMDFFVNHVKTCNVDEDPFVGVTEKAVQYYNLENYVEELYVNYIIKNDG